MQNLSNISVIRICSPAMASPFPRPWARISSSIRRSAPGMAELGRRCARHRYDRDRRRYRCAHSRACQAGGQGGLCGDRQPSAPHSGRTLGEFDNIRIVNDDVLKVDLHRLIEEEFAGMEVAVCANLPYYITSPILMHLLEEKLPIRSITVMVQKEAAARLTAEPGTREVGAISIALRYYCTPSVLFQVSRGSFMPAPMWTPR